LDLRTPARPRAPGDRRRRRAREGGRRPRRHPVGPRLRPRHRAAVRRGPARPPARRARHGPMSAPRTRVAASFWSTPRDRVAAEADRLARAGLRTVHWDRTDGRFAAAGGFTASEAAAVTSGSGLAAEAHLMV